jgi:hypothetical protein
LDCKPVLKNSVKRSHAVYSRKKMPQVLVDLDAEALVLVDPDKVDPDKVDPDKVDPDKVGPDKVGPVKVDPDKVDPDKVDPDKVDLDKVDPDKVDLVLEVEVRVTAAAKRAGAVA